MKYKTKVIVISEVFHSTQSNLIKNSLKENKRIYGIKLEGLKGLIGYELIPSRRIGTELADVAKRFGLKGIIHSDELPGYGISHEEVESIRKLLNCSENDAFIMIISKDFNEAKKVFNFIINRLNQFINDGIPKDTRQANEDGTTSFLRPQPGAERMYPETDHPYIEINRKVEDKNEYQKITYYIKYGDKSLSYDIYKLKRFDKELYMKFLSEGKTILNDLDPNFNIELLKSFGYNEKQINDILWSEYIYDIKKLSTIIEPNIVYYLFFQLLSDTSNIFKEKIEQLDINFIYKIAEFLKDRKISKNAIPIIYYYYLKEKKDIETIIKEKDLYLRDINKLKEEISKFIEENKEKDKKLLVQLIFNKFKYIANTKDIEKVMKELKII